MTGSLPYKFLAGLEIVGLGTGNGGAAEQEQMARAIREFYALLQAGDLKVDIDRVPLDQVADVWHREQSGRRPVLIP